MRPAPPVEPAADDPTLPPDPDLDKPSIAAGRAARHVGRSGWLASRLLVGIVALALIGVATAFLISRTNLLPPKKQGPHLPSPPLPSVFSFDSVKVIPVRVNQHASTTAAQPVAQSVQAALLAFYERGFINRSTWSRGVPKDAWNVFAQSLRARAQSDVASLALGNQAPTLQSLFIERSSITIRVLLDQVGHPQAATADVVLEAVGTLRTRQRISVTSTASFLFRRLDRAWLIAGYPRASISIEPTQTPTPGPTTPSPPGSASGSPPQSPTPAPGGSP